MACSVFVELEWGSMLGVTRVGGFRVWMFHMWALQLRSVELSHIDMSTVRLHVGTQHMATIEDIVGSRNLRETEAGNSVSHACSSAHMVKVLG